MNHFTDEEMLYLREQRLGRLATVGPDGQPHVVPVGFRLNADLGTIDIGGHEFANRKKFRDVQRNPRVAFVVDDLVSVSPWRVRGIEVRGEAAILATGERRSGQDSIPSCSAFVRTASRIGDSTMRSRSGPVPGPLGIDYSGPNAFRGIAVGS